MNRTGCEADMRSDPASLTHPPAGLAQAPQLLELQPPDPQNKTAAPTLEDG